MPAKAKYVFNQRSDLLARPFGRNQSERMLNFFKLPKFNWDYLICENKSVSLKVSQKRKNKGKGNAGSPLRSAKSRIDGLGFRVSFQNQ